MNSYLDEKNIKHLTGLIGSPVSHSLSPSLFKVFYFQNKMEGYKYVIIDSSIKGLEETIKSLDKRFVGFNVTMPDKIKIIDYLDELTDEVKQIGAVNTVKIQDGKLIGYNTDGKGCLNSLINNGVDVNNKNVLIYGAGGAAKAINYELKNNGANVTMLHRPSEHDLKNALTESDIFINASPVGMDTYNSPIEDFSGVKKDLFVFDLIYKNSYNKLYKLSKLAGLRYIDGYDMLVEQAKLSFEIFHK